MPELTTNQSVLLTDIALCVNHYRLFTPGIYVCLHVPVTLDENTRIVPGLISMTNYGQMKQCEAVEHGFEGPPNFVLDVFEPDDTAEYQRRREIFERFGVMEYVALMTDEAPSPHWNRLENGKFLEVTPDKWGMYKSKALPGLWIPADALAKRDWWTICSTIERGTTRQGHHEFQDSIWHGDRGDGVIPFDAG